MGSVLLKMDDQHEKKLRQMAKEKFGGKKGSITKVVESLLDAETEKKNKKVKEALERIHEIVMKNKKKAKIGYKFNRDEIYAERLSRL